MYRHSTRRLTFLLAVCVHGWAFAKVDFQKEVRPILSDACFHCHGNDRTTRMAGLRLDTKEGAFAKRAKGAAIVAGNAKASLLVQRITSPVAARRMPPEYSHKVLSEDQKQTLQRWINEGAKWEEHWAFAAPARPVVPAVKNEAWARNAVDRFVLAKLEAQGLTPAAEADKRTLLRRVTLDLTGLPPTPDEVQAFLADGSSGAFEKVVDRLLASPRWGEHRGRYWLDAARYGDTHGVHIDNYREIWPYRDWVINAFNANMPFDRFTIEQLAGDLLPKPTLEQKIATGFQRCNVTTNEAGVIIDEVEAIYAKDRADTVGAVWLGMTVGCATCHDHKFDPIPTRDFYAMTAFFRNTTQHAMDGNISDTPPIVVVPASADVPRWAELDGQETALRARLAEARRARMAQTGGSAAKPVELLSLRMNGAIERVDAGGAHPVAFSEGIGLGGSPWADRMAVHFSPAATVELPGLEQIDTDRAFSVSAWIYYPKVEGGFTIAAQQDGEQKNRGWSFFVSSRIPGVRLIGDEGKAVDVRAGHLDQLIPGTWNHVAFSYDGSGEAMGVRMFMNGHEVKTQRDSKAKVRGSIANKAPLKLLARQGAIADFRVFDRTLAAEEVALLNPGEPAALQAFSALWGDGQYQEVASQLRAIDMERREIRRRGAVSLVMEERADQKPFAHVLYRGMYDQPRAKVEASTPSVLPAMAAGLPKNRLGLAQWLVDASNPLTARVTVNRFWQELFGTGIVKTTEDFGSQGEAPVNQGLLDWMAVEFREGGWDVKKFFRMLVTSAAYRQSAVVTPEKLEKDPDNRLLSRGARYRMEGEMVRDYALAASGLMAKQIGGASARPYQPDGVWEAVAMEGSDTRFYKRDEGEKLYRRSMYTFWKRSAPPASMEIFNAPTRETCTVRRERTNTPLQALVTMNDPQFVEAARVLAARAMAAKADVEQRFDYLSWQLMARPLEERERAIVRAAYRDFLRHYDSQPADAKKLLATGEAKTDESLAPAELAALTMVTNQLMNLDEVLTK
jgi:hypothetical protein